MLFRSSFWFPSHDSGRGGSEILGLQMIGAQKALIEAQTEKTKAEAEKQPAWINYMTSVNRTFGNFAIQNNQMWMTLNRRYESDDLDETTCDSDLADR